MRHKKRKGQVVQKSARFWLYFLVFSCVSSKKQNQQILRRRLDKQVIVIQLLKSYYKLLSYVL